MPSGDSRRGRKRFFVEVFAQVEGSAYGRLLFSDLDTSDSVASANLSDNSDPHPLVQESVVMQAVVFVCFDDSQAQEMASVDVPDQIPNEALPAIRVKPIRERLLKGERPEVNRGVLVKKFLAGQVPSCL